jgi:hypothetical protein
MPIIIIVFTLGGEEIWILKNSKLPILGYPHRPAHKQTLFSFGQVFVTREGGQTPRPGGGGGGGGRHASISFKAYHFVRTNASRNNSVNLIYFLNSVNGIYFFNNSAGLRVRATESSPNGRKLWKIVRAQV